ncbi:MAG: sigma-70 family RNA polymerase sigma factor [Oscillospiraceae bacterium]|nr:sigma-70 family RNA polymerase sigma factor [Oscillospiraceae bacterium]
MDEKKWLKKAAAGSAEAFEQLVLKYQTAVYNLCLRMTGDPEDAADMTQESFLKAWRNLESFQGNSAFSTWLYRLASNTCLDHLRSVKRKPQLSLVMEDEDGETQALDVPDSAPSPEEQVIALDEQSRLNDALQALDEDQRQILILRAVNGLSYTEIAEALHLKEGTVKSRLARAREQLRKKLQQNGNNSPAPTSKKQKGGGDGEL